MPSLRELLATSTPFLLLDTASTRVQAGVFAGRAEPDRWAASDEESGVALFRCLERLSVDPAAMRAFVLCDGPGSVLGVRTAAMAVRAWCALAPRPCYAFASLQLVAEATGRTVISDARRGHWHLASPGQSPGRVGRHEIPPAAVTPAGFRAWTPLPDDIEQVEYAVRDLLARVPDHDLFKSTAEPDAFLHAEPAYVTWTPQIHRAP